MGRGSRWTEAENQLLQEMVKEGMTVEQIYRSRIFLGRTYKAVLNQIQRLGAHLSTQSKTLLSTQIREAEMIDLETMVKRFVDAFNKICDATQCSKEDLERFRIIFSSARVYFDLYFKLEKFSEVKNRVERLEATVAQLEAEKKTEKPQQAA